MKRSDIQHKNLADLHSIQIHVNDEKPESFEQIECTEIEVETESIVSETLSTLEQKVKDLLLNSELNDGEREELQQELAAVKSGDEEAVQRLSDLIYYIE